MNEKLWTSDELQREEIRGVFVIGLIATFLSIRPYIQTHEFNQLLISQELINGILLNFTTFLIAFWGVYLFLIIISLSDDIKLPYKENEEPWISKENFSNVKMVAHFMFIGGIYIVYLYILILLIFIGVSILVLLVPIVILVWLFKLPYKLLVVFYRFVLQGLRKLRNKM